MDLRICPYNCCPLNKNVDIVRELADVGYDFIFLQETLVTEDRLGDLNYIHEEYEAVGSGAVYSDRALQSNAGRCTGGVACLWRREASLSIDKVFIEKDYIVLSVICGSLTLVFVNVYIRSDIWEIRTHNEYLEMLSKLEAIISETKFDSI